MSTILIFHNIILAPWYFWRRKKPSSYWYKPIFTFYGKNVLFPLQFFPLISPPLLIYWETPLSTILVIVYYLWWWWWKHYQYQLSEAIGNVVFRKTVSILTNHCMITDMFSCYFHVCCDFIYNKKCKKNHLYNYLRLFSSNPEHIMLRPQAQLLLSWKVLTALSVLFHWGTLGLRFPTKQGKKLPFPNVSWILTLVVN